MNNEIELNLTDLANVSLVDFTMWMRINYDAPLDLGNFIKYVQDYQKIYG